MASNDDVLDKLRSLALRDRIEFLAALEKEARKNWDPPSAEWTEEVRRRGNLYDRGEMSSDSWETVRERARKKAGLEV